MPSISFDWNEAATQLTRYTGGWQPTYGTPLIMTYAYRVTGNAPDEPVGVPEGNWIGGLPAGATGFSQFTAGQIGVKIQFATLSPGLLLTTADFLVI